MKKGVIIVIIIVVIVVLAVLLGKGGGVPPGTATPGGREGETRELAPPAIDAPTPPEALAEAVRVALQEQNKSGESGTAIIVEVDGRVKVSIDLKGIPANANQPAHIHTGSCDKLGDVKYPLGSIGLANDSILSVSKAQLLSELPLAINVHKSGAEVSVYVACGDITGR